MNFAELSAVLVQQQVQEQQQQPREVEGTPYGLEFASVLAVVAQPVWV